MHGAAGSPDRTEPHCVKLPFSPTRLRSVLGVLVVALALYALEHEFRDTHWDQLMAELRAVPLRALAAGLALTLASYALLVLFDRQGLALVDKHVAPVRLAATSFVANALGHSLGLAPLTGGTVRLKGYGDAGVGLADVGRIAVHVSLAFLLGAWSLTGLTLAAAPAHLAAVLPGDATFWRALGVVILGVLAAGLLALGRQPRQLSIGRIALRLPARHVAALALVISAAELCCAAGALYVMLPDGAPPFVEFAGSYVIAILAGVISTVPAGLGVFEWTLIQTLPQIDRNALLASIVAYRLVYYVVPLLLALAGMVLWSVGGTARRFSRLAASVIPAVAAAAVFTAGAWLLVAGVLPVPDQTVVSAPLPLLELSHLLGSLLGVFLLVLALGIQRCSHGAWLLTLGVLAAGVPIALIRGDPPLLIAAFVVLAALLLAGRSHFSRPAAVLEARFSPIWWRNVALVVLGTGWLMLFAYRNVPYRNRLWWQFELSGDAPRALRALLAVVIVLSLVALWQLLRPAPRRDPLPDREQLDALKPRIDAAARSQANLAYLGDKALLTTGTSGLLMFRQGGRSLIAMGDPLGSAEERARLRWTFREMADQRDLRCVFYQVEREDLEAYLDLGLALVKLGEEAVVDLTRFGLEGSARAELRQSRNRGQREGLRVVHLAAAEVAPWLPALRRISDQWLALKAGSEKGFSLGFFDEDYLRRFPAAVVLTADGTPVAFANLWPAPAGGELSIDLMRHAADAPRGVMDFLFIELMLWGKAQGYRSFNLGMAPLSGMARHRLAARSQRLLGFLAGHGERFYGFEGLRRYKDKFGPDWRPRYLAAPGGVHLAGVFLDLTRLINRGPAALRGQPHLSTPTRSDS